MKLISVATSRLTGLSLWKSSCLIFALALAMRLTFIVIAQPYRDLSRYELERTALSLSSTGVYGNPYAIPTGPTAHVSPGYTVILASLFHVAGDGIRGEIIKEVISAAVSSIGFALLPFASNRMLNKTSPGIFAGLICALIPWKPMVQIDGDWETPYTALFLTVLVPLTIELWRRNSFTWRKAVAHGTLWGVGLLFASVLLPLLPVLAVVGFCFFRGARPGRYTRFLALEFLVAALCLAPWILRNERSLGAPIATRSNLGLELRVSNNDDATADQRANLLLGVYDRYHPLQNVEEARRVRTLGEVAYNKWASAQAKNWIRSHPSRFVALTLRRILDFWFYPDPSRVKAIIGDLTALLGFVGLIQVWRQDKISGAVLASVLLVYSAPSYLIHVGARQRFPVDWLLVLLSVVAVEHYMSQVRHRNDVPFKP